ncbi:MAG TPA: MarR family transcriptional regulator [Cellulomonas sp.]
MNDELDPASLALAQHVVRLQTLLGARAAPVLRAHEISRSELDVLSTLTEIGEAGARPGELSTALLLTTGGLSNIVRRLHEDGLVEREADEADGRSHRVLITPYGAATADETAREVGAELTLALAPVPTSLVEAATQLLHELLVVLGEDTATHRVLEPRVARPVPDGA